MPEILPKKKWPWLSAIIVFCFVLFSEIALFDSTQWWDWITVVTLPFVFGSLPIAIAITSYADGYKKGSRNALLDSRSGELWVNWDALEADRRNDP